MDKIKDTSIITDSIMRIQKEINLDELTIKKRLETQNAVRVYDRVREDLEKVATDEEIVSNNNIIEEAIGKQVIAEDKNVEILIESYNNYTLETLKEIYYTFEDEIGNSLEEFSRKIVKEGIKKENLKDNVCVEIMFTDPKVIANLNQKTRNNPKTTDVLSFPEYTKKELENNLEIFKEKNQKEDDLSKIMLGSMAISLARVYRNGRRYETGLKREMAYMIVHSFYHLLGYDHLNDEDKKIMRKKEEELLKILDID